jgi:hypothetical protein
MAEDKPWEISLADLPVESWSKPLAPLYAHRARMLAFDGMSLATAELDMDGNRHDTGFVQAWTGNWVDFGSTEARAQSASLDQIVAAEIARADRLPSLEVAVDGSAEPGRPVSYAFNGARLPVESDASRVWKRLFGASAKPSPYTKQQKSVLDYAWAEYAAHAPQLSADQRQRLDTHFDLVNSLGKRLEGMAKLSCASNTEEPANKPSYDERFDTMSELIGAAFACDVTRVATLTLGEMPTKDFGWDHLSDNVHKGMAHGIYQSSAKHEAMTDYLALHSAQVGRLVKLLSNLQDTNGKSVMDNTLIVWGSELADGWHGYQNYCPVLIGGDWHFKPGRYLYQPHQTPVEMLMPGQKSKTGWSTYSGLPHQHLLVSAAQAMGLKTDYVGLKHFQGQRGDHIDCSGPIPGLT